MELNQKQIQDAIKDINTVFGMAPKLRIIGPKDLLRSQIIDTVAKAIEDQDPKVQQLAGETVDVYNVLIGAQPDEVPTPSEQEIGDMSGDYQGEPAGNPNEQDCFGVSHDPDAPECQPDVCGRAKECAGVVANKGRPVKKEKAGATPKAPSTRQKMLDILCSNPSFTKEEFLNAVKQDVGEVTASTASTVYSDTMAVVNRLKANGLLNT